MEYPSNLFKKAVEEISQLPGIGKRTAFRLVLHLLKQPKDLTLRISDSISELRKKINYCSSCFNISDSEICSICSNSLRNSNIICIVEDVRDVIAIESTGQFKGLYHVLGGKISPIDGISPNDLKIEELINRLDNCRVDEVIFALGNTMEGDTTNYYIFKKLNKYNLKFSAISRGIGVGDELEYADEITLGRSITNRIPFEVSLKS